MMRLILLALVLVAIVNADTHTCRLRRGIKLRTFSNTKERIKIPCKYNAVRNTVCGSWRVTVTPGNAIDYNADKRYIVKTMWVGVERISDGMKWEGRTDIRIAGKYLDDPARVPYNKKDGALEITDVFTYGADSTGEGVYLMEKNGQFSVNFSVYDSDDTWRARSGWQFDCYSSFFEPSIFPIEICGNGTKDEVKEFMKAKGWKDSRMAGLFYEVFTNTDIAQTDSDCKSTENALANKCSTEAERFNASSQCWPLVGKFRFIKCITRNLERPESTMRHCVEFACSGYKDLNACYALADEIDGCQELEGISQRVKDLCDPDLSIKK